MIFHFFPPVCAMQSFHTILLLYSEVHILRIVLFVLKFLPKRAFRYILCFNSGQCVYYRQRGSQKPSRALYPKPKDSAHSLGKCLCVQPHCVGRHPSKSVFWRPGSWHTAGRIQTVQYYNNTPGNTPGTDNIRGFIYSRLILSVPVVSEKQWFAGEGQN